MVDIGLSYRLSWMPTASPPSIPYPQNSFREGYLSEANYQAARSSAGSKATCYAGGLYGRGHDLHEHIAKVRTRAFFAAIAGLGAAYAVFEHHQANRLVHSINEGMPSFLILILLLVVYGLFRTAVSVLNQLNGVSLAAAAG